MEQIYLTDITGTLGEWVSMDFDDEVPKEVVALLEKVYILATKELEKPL